MSGNTLISNLSSKLSCRVSCTVTINHRSVCVHDNIWKRCKVSLEPPMAGVNAGLLRNRKDTPSPILSAKSRLHGRN